MTGWNMPPGCSERDIPGNRPEDQAIEAFYEFLAEIGIPDDDKFDAIAEALWKKMGDAYGEGYAQGQSDEAQAKEWKDNNAREEGCRYERAFGDRYDAGD